MCDPTQHKAVAMDIETTGKDVNRDIMTVVCIWSPTMQLSRFHFDDYADVVSVLNEVDYILTFNGIHFDIPILARHCKVNPSHWIQKTVDPLFLVQNTLGYEASRKLDLVLQENGFECKSASGKDAIEYWFDKKYDLLESYCMQDARLTYGLCSLRKIRWSPTYSLNLYDNENVVQLNK